MAKIRIPPIDVAAIDPDTGCFVPDWWDVLKALEKLGMLDLADVSTTAPTNGQVPIYNSTTKLLTFGAN